MINVHFQQLQEEPTVEKNNQASEVSEASRSHDSIGSNQIGAGLSDTDHTQSSATSTLASANSTSAFTSAAATSHVYSLEATPTPDNAKVNAWKRDSLSIPAFYYDLTKSSRIKFIESCKLSFMESL